MKIQEKIDYNAKISEQLTRKRKDYEDKIYELNYEELVKNQEYETKKLIDHIGLEWQEECLKPEYNKRFITTNSSSQIRQKLYQESSQQWQKYKHFLGGAFDSFAELHF